MSNIVTSFDALKRQRNYPHDVTVVEHHGKPDQNPRVSVLIYKATGTGLAVATLEKNEIHWGVSEVKGLNDYYGAKWPQHTDAPTDEGAVNLIVGLLDFAVAHDGVY
jgi:hypothetical protein